MGRFLVVGAGSILTSFLLCGLFVLFVGAGILALLPDRALRQAAHWRGEMLTALWGGIGVLATVGAALRVEGGVSWCPVFGLDGPTLPMLVLLAFTGGMISRGRRGMACVLTGLAFLALSPLVFGLLAGTALVMLADRGRQGVCLPVAVIPACIPADSPLSPLLLCLMVLLLGWGVSSQKGPEAMLPAGIGLFLFGRLLAEEGILDPVQQTLLLLSGGAVALGGCVQALRAPLAARVASGLASAGFGALVVLLTLALGTSLEGMEQFRTATLLGAGAPFLALLALLWLCRGEDEANADAPFFSPHSLATATPAGRILLGMAVLMLSGLPPLGGFSVLWCLLTAGELAAVGAQPVQALCTILVLVGAAGLMVLGVLGLLRLALAALARQKMQVAQQTPAPDGYGLLLLPAGVSLGAAVAVAVLPGGWLALMDHLFVGTAPRDFSWRTLLSVWFVDTTISFTPLFCVLALLVCVGMAITVGRVLGFYPFRQPQAARAAWQEAGPVVALGDGVMASSKTDPAVLWTVLLVFLGLEKQTPASWPLVEKTAAAGRSMRSMLFRTVGWCEAQGMVLILLFLGAGLILGLFTSK